MSRPVWFVNLIKKLFPERHTFAKLTNVPLIGNMVDFGLFRGDDIIYLPKDHTIQINARIDHPGDVVLPSQIVEHFIEQASYHWIMDFCLCRSGNECQDYPVESGCIFLGEAVLQINPQFGRLVTKEEALQHARRCRASGLVHMIGRNKLDSVWLGANPNHKLLTICNCCPCCCLWGVIPQLTPLISNKINKMPGLSVQVSGLCAGCGTCSEGICFVDAIHMNSGHAVISEACRGCGRCVEICPNEAIELAIEDASFVQKAIERITPLVKID